MRRSALLLFPALSWATACSMDWGSLEPLEGGAPFDGSSGDVTRTPDAHGDVFTNPADSSTDGSGNDATSDDGSSNDGSNADATGANDGGGSDGAGTDASDAGTSGGDASDGSTGADASDGAVSDGSDGGTCAYKVTGTLATWDLTGQPGNEASASSTSAAAGITAGAITRSSGLTGVNGTNSINSSGWSTATSVDKTLYYTVTITPPAGCNLSITSIYLDTKISLDGPGSGDVGTSADSFTSLTAFTPGTAGANTLSVSGSATAVEIRVYGYNAVATAGTMRIQNSMTVSGSLK